MKYTILRIHHQVKDSLERSGIEVLERLVPIGEETEAKARMSWRKD